MAGYELRSLGKLCYQSGIMIRPAGLQTLLSHVNNPITNGIEYGVPLTEDQITDLIEKLGQFDFVDAD